MPEPEQNNEALLLNRRRRVVQNSQGGLTAALGVLLFLILGLFWLGNSISEASTSDSAISEGERLYIQNCAPCHARDGSGNASINAPAINQDGRAWQQSREALEAHILEGGESMPALAGQVRTEDVAVILSFIQGWWTDQQRQSFQSNP